LFRQVLPLAGRRQGDFGLALLGSGGLDMRGGLIHLGPSRFDFRLPCFYLFSGRLRLSGDGGDVGFGSPDLGLRTALAGLGGPGPSSHRFDTLLRRLSLLLQSFHSGRSGLLLGLGLSHIRPSGPHFRLPGGDTFSGCLRPGLYHFDQLGGGLGFRLGRRQVATSGP
jgi:hypothetical protein